MSILPVVLIVLIAMWFLGYIPIPWLTIPTWPLFTFNGQVITIYHVIMLILVVWALSFMPGPVRMVAGILLAVWLLSILGISILGGLSHWIMIGLIIAIALPLLRWR
jgi:hypothetical protein